MITKSLTLDLIPGRNNVTIPVSQYDSDSRIYEITVLEGDTEFEVPDGSTVTVRGTKVDNTGFEYPCTYAGSLVKMTIKQQMTLFAGPVYCELRIVNQGKILGSANFTLLVEPTTLKGDVEISETDLPLIEQVIEDSADVRAMYKDIQEWNSETSDNTSKAGAYNASTLATYAQLKSDLESAIEEMETLKDEASHYAGASTYSIMVDSKGYICLDYKEDL